MAPSLSSLALLLASSLSPSVLGALSINETSTAIQLSNDRFSARYVVIVF